MSFWFFLMVSSSASFCLISRSRSMFSSGKSNHLRVIFGLRAEPRIFESAAGNVGLVGRGQQRFDQFQFQIEFGDFQLAFLGSGPLGLQGRSAPIAETARTPALIAA